MCESFTDQAVALQVKLHEVSKYSNSQPHFPYPLHPTPNPPTPQPETINHKLCTLYSTRFMVWESGFGIQSV